LYIFVSSTSQRNVVLPFSGRSQEEFKTK
jgi:hypothetical protein